MKQVLILLTVAMSLVNLNCQGQSKGYLLALSKTDHTLSILDPASFNILAKLPVGSDPHEVVASTDGKTAYVSIYGGGSLHELNVFDLVGLKPLATVDTRPLYGPHGLVFVNGKAWFSAEGSKAVGSYDPASGKLDWSMGTGQDRTHMIYVTGDQKSIYHEHGFRNGKYSFKHRDSTGPNAPPGAGPGKNGFKRSFRHP